MIGVTELENHFRQVSETRMRGLPICNPRLAVEAVCFAAFDEHQVGVLITPWFMNLVLLPGTDEWAACEQGERCDVRLPSGDFEFTVDHNEVLGSFLSAVLFRSVAEFPDQDMARDTAAEVLRMLRESPPPPESRTYSRRALLRGETVDA